MSDMPEKIQVTKVFPSGDRVNTWREGSPYVHGTEYTRSDLIEQLQAEVDALKREVDEQNKTANYYRQETINRGVEKKQLQAKVEKAEEMKGAILFLKASTSGTAQWHTALRRLWAAEATYQGENNE